MKLQRWMLQLIHSCVSHVWRMIIVLVLYQLIILFYFYNRKQFYIGGFACDVFQVFHESLWFILTAKGGFVRMFDRFRPLILFILLAAVFVDNPASDWTPTALFTLKSQTADRSCRSYTGTSQQTRLDFRFMFGIGCQEYFNGLTSPSVRTRWDTCHFHANPPCDTVCRTMCRTT